MTTKSVNTMSISQFSENMRHSGYSFKMKHRLLILFLLCTCYASGQEAETRCSYFMINPFNAGINQIALTYEKRHERTGLNLTIGYVYQRTENALNGFGIVPANYIVANTFYAYKGFLFYPGYNHYLKKNPDSWFGVKGVFKYMYHDSLDLAWQWNQGQSFTRRVQSDKLFVIGAEFLYGVKKEITKLFFYEIFAGIGLRVKFHNLTVYDSYLDKDPQQHQDPSYPFDQKIRLLKPTIHLGINLGLKL